MQNRLITVYKSLQSENDPKYVKLDVMLNRIKSGKIKSVIDELRLITDVDEYRKKKQSILPCICFSGTISKPKRLDAALVDHSGLITIDFDHIANPKELKDELRKDPHAVAVFISPSNAGVKMLYRVTQVKDNHRKHFAAIRLKYPNIDKSGANESRVCFESVDTDIYINYEAQEFTEMVEPEMKPLAPITHNTHDLKKLAVACQMIRNSIDGEKHEILLKAAKLCGGYISIGKLVEDRTINELTEEIRQKNPSDLAGAIKTITDGIEYGKKQPISEAIKIEREQRYLKHETGEFDFIASELSMNQYLDKLYLGQIEMGKETHIEFLDDHWRYKNNTFTIWLGIDNVGKSTVAWYLALLSAMYHDWKWIIYSCENTDAHLKKKFIEFYWGIPFQKQGRDQIKAADKFYQSHFKIISSEKDMYTCDEILDMGAVLCETYGMFNGFLVEPYNALKMENLNVNRNEYNYQCLAKIRLFAKTYCSVWICAHTVTEASRDLDPNGDAKVPHKSKVEGGQPFCNRADDIGIIHRKPKNKFEYMNTEIHIDKIKDMDTGGKSTYGAEPIIITMTPNRCAFVDKAGYDPVQSWHNKDRSIPIDFEYEKRVQEIQRFSSKYDPEPEPETLSIQQPNF